MGIGDETEIGEYRYHVPRQDVLDDPVEVLERGLIERCVLYLQFEMHRNPYEPKPSISDRIEGMCFDMPSRESTGRHGNGKFEIDPTTFTW